MLSFEEHASYIETGMLDPGVALGSCCCSVLCSNSLTNLTYNNVGITRGRLLGEDVAVLVSVSLWSN